MMDWEGCRRKLASYFKELINTNISPGRAEENHNFSHSCDMAKI
jgi:hypothetical protein